MLLINKFRGLLLVAAFIVPLCDSRKSNRRDRRPHIILIVADDLGWADAGWRDPEMHTPTLDRMAKEGVVLNQFYVQTSCTPSRAALLTGKYPFRMGLQGAVISAGKNEYLPAEETLLPQYLKGLGYATHMVGKWHLGFCDWKYTPTHRFFDSFYGFYNGVQGYYNHTGHKGGYDFRDNEKVDWSAKGTYSTHLFGSRAQRIVKEHNASQPLFLFLSFQAVHGPLEVPQEYIDNYCSHVQDKSRRVRCGMIAAMDKAIGGVSQSLQDSGLADKALVMFMTDNGGPVNKGSSNWPLRGSKGGLWEGGNRAISFLYTENRNLLPKSGVPFKGLMHVTDVLPTLLAAAGTHRTALPRGLDGVSMWRHIRRLRKRGPRREMVYNINEVRENAAIRVGRWKLIEGHPGHKDGWMYAPKGAKVPRRPAGKRPDLHLFDLKRDPQESKNLAEKRPALVMKLAAKLKKYRRDLVPSFTKSATLPNSHPKYFNNTWSPGFCSNETAKPTEPC